MKAKRKLLSALLKAKTDNLDDPNDYDWLISSHCAMGKIAIAAGIDYGEIESSIQGLWSNEIFKASYILQRLEEIGISEEDIEVIEHLDYKFNYLKAEGFNCYLDTKIEWCEKELGVGK